MSRIGINAVGDVGSSCRAAVDVVDRYQQGSRCGRSVSTRSAMYEVAVAWPSESRIGIDTVGDVGSSCRAAIDVADRYQHGSQCGGSVLTRSAMYKEPSRGRRSRGSVSTRLATSEAAVALPLMWRIDIDVVSDVGSSCRAAVGGIDQYRCDSRCSGSVSTRSAM